MRPACHSHLSLSVVDTLSSLVSLLSTTLSSCMNKFVLLPPLPLLLSLSELLPQEYIKVKGIEKVIFHVCMILSLAVCLSTMTMSFTLFVCLCCSPLPASALSLSWMCDVLCLSSQEHNKLGTMTDLQAKFRYIQDCRNLRTYGVTFFLVKASCSCWTECMLWTISTVFCGYL